MELGFYNEEVLKAVLLASPGTGDMLTREANRVVPVAKENLDRLFPPAGLIGAPPARRTGDLQRSVHVEAAGEENGLPTVEVVANASHNGLYAPWLLQRGYLFITNHQLQALGFKVGED